MFGQGPACKTHKRTINLTKSKTVAQFYKKGQRHN